MATRVLVLGLDALDERIVDQAVAQGLMPRLGEILQASTRAATHWPRPLGTGLLWPTIWTAVPPQEHGYPFWGETPDRRARATCQVTPFYVQLAQAGRSVAVLDAPYAPAGDGYLHVSNWLVHDKDTRGVATGATAGLKAAEVARQLGRERWCACDTVPRNAQAHQALAQRLVERTQRQAGAAQAVIEATDLDLAISVFSTSHCAVHHLWQDPPAGAQPFERVLCALDDAVGALATSAGPECATVLLSGHGARPRTTGNHFTSEFLTRAFALLPARLRMRAGRSLVTLLRPRDSKARRRAWKSIPYHEFSGAVRLRRKGRDGSGALDDASAQRLISMFKEQARSLRDLDTGEPAVADVVVTQESWPDHDLPAWPDLFLVWNEHTPLLRIGSEALGEFEGRPGGHRSGDHCGEGFIALRSGAPARRMHDPVELVDVGPTVAALLGVSLPGARGRPLDVHRLATP